VIFRGIIVGIDFQDWPFSRHEFRRIIEKIGFVAGQNQIFNRISDCHSTARLGGTGTGIIGQILTDKHAGSFSHGYGTNEYGQVIPIVPDCAF
jgi:hypothetical protein